MHAAIPEDCFLQLPAEITPDLARSCADKMNLLLQVQLLGRTLSDVDSALRLIVDLAKEVTEYDRAVLYWREDDEGPFQVRAQRGFRTGATPAQSSALLLSRQTLKRPRVVLLTADTCTPTLRTALLDPVGAASLLAIPLYVGGRVMGSLQLLRERGPAFSNQEAHLVRVFTFGFENLLETIHYGEGPREMLFLDPVTGVFNRKYFEQQLEREFDRARRNSEAASVLVVELGGFAEFREQQGPAVTEALLEETSQALRRVARKSDTVARLEDNRFALILPRTGKPNLGIVAQRAFDALGEPLLPDLPGAADHQVSYNLCAVAYPDDAFSPEGALEALDEGLEQARRMPGKHYYQFPAQSIQDTREDILDMSRVGLFHEPSLYPARLLRVFARLCLDSVPADRVSIMVRDGEELVIQVAFGFEGQDELVRTTRVPLNQQTVSAWVAQQRKPLLVTGTEDARQLPLNGGPNYANASFFSYPLTQGEELIGVIHFSNRIDGGPFTTEDVEHFRPLAQAISGYLTLGNRFGDVQEEFLRDSLFALVDLMECQVPGMEGHSREVARLAEATARHLGYAGSDLEKLRVSSRLHDLGKINYRAHILSEARALSPRERALTQRHPLLAWKLLDEIPLQVIDKEAILYHHEREDGSGYLHKTAGEVPQPAKILAVADVYQALTSARPYRPAVGPAEAVSYIEAHKGSLFDIQVVEAFCSGLADLAGSA